MSSPRIQDLSADERRDMAGKILERFKRALRVELAAEKWAEALSRAESGQTSAAEVSRAAAELLRVVKEGT